MGDADLSPAAQRAIAAYARLKHALHAAAPTAWLSTDLTLGQLRVLLYLHARGRGSGRELARVLGVGPSAVSQLVDRLVAHGQVQRAEAPDDRRITWLTLTPAGQATAERLLLEGREHLAEVVALLTPAEQARVAEAFELLATAAARLPISPEEPGC